MKKLFSLLLLSLILISCEPEAESQTFNVYYSNSSLVADPNSCDEVFGTERLFVRDVDTEGKVKIALEELLKGPTFFEESDESYFSFFSKETAGYLLGVEVKGSTAYVDFKDFSKVIPNASSSCGSAQLLAELNHTVLQFEEVEKAIYSFEGSTENFYEWLQMSAPE